MEPFERAGKDPESAQHPSQQVGSRGRKSTDFQQLAPLQKMSPGTNMVAIATTQHTAAHPDPLTPSGTSLTEGMAFSVGIGARQQVLLSTTLLDPRSARRSVYLCLLFALLQVEELHGGPKRL